MRYADRLDLQRYLDRLLSRSILTDEEQEAILDLPCHYEKVRPNEDFVGLGEDVDQACLIVDGFAGRFDQSANGARQITAIHVPGDMADMHSVVQTRTTSALQALSLTTIMRIPHDAIRSAAARLPALAEAFWRDCMVDTAILSQWVVNVGRRDAKARIGHLICEIATRLKAPMEEGVIRFPFAVTQHQLADATGLTAVHVNRILKALRDDGLAEVVRREVRISDWPRLVEAADFDRRYLQVDVPPHDRPRILALA